MKTSSNFFNFNLPKVRFHKVIKKRLSHFFKTELSENSENI